MENLNIVELIEKNPIAKLSVAYNNRLLNKIKENFSGFEQQLFISSFYCYLNYDKNVDFVIDLDDIWKWLGFSQKIRAKEILEKHFKLDIDYKTGLFCQKAVSDIIKNNKDIEEKKHAKQNGGQNKIKYMLSIKCFKSLCLKAQTNKASEIHEYYMKMEDVLQQIIDEESSELRLQLEQKDNVIQQKEDVIQQKENVIKNTKKEKQRAIEQTIIHQFPINTECIYFGTIDNTNDAQEKLIKFGHTNDLATRVSYHRKQYNNFILIEAFRVQNKVEIENLIKTYPKIKKHIRTIEVNGKNKTEIIAYDATNFTIERLSKHIRDIIHSKTYSIDNFNRIMKENEKLEKENNDLREQLKLQEQLVTQKTIEINHLQEKLDNNEKIIVNAVNQEESVYKNVLLPEDELNQKFNEFVKEICIVRPDVEELSVNMEGRYRVWNKIKPTKEMFHALKNYLDTRFKPKRINGNHGYVGIKLKPVEYKKSHENNIAEMFIFQVCVFSDSGKILNSILLTEYQKWKYSVNKEINGNEMKEIKDYLNACPYALKATVWTSDGNNEGYYGLQLKQTEYKPKLVSSTGKKVYKKQIQTDIILASWDTIAKAALAENISTAKMSRSVKNKTVVNDYYYTSD
jgi:hypothetical protein